MTVTIQRKSSIGGFLLVAFLGRVLGTRLDQGNCPDYSNSPPPVAIRPPQNSPGVVEASVAQSTYDDAKTVQPFAVTCAMTAAKAAMSSAYQMTFPVSWRSATITRGR